MDFEKLKQFALSDWLHDLKLIFRNSQEESFELPVHKIILASQSDFFFHLFKENPNLTSLELPVSIDSFHRETSLQDCKNILQFIYSGKNFDHLLSQLGLSEDNCLNYFSIAKMLGLEGLETQISRYVLDIGFKRGNELDSLKNTIKFGNTQWENDLMRRIARKFQTLSYLHVSKEKDDEEEIKKLNGNRDKLLELPLKKFNILLERNDLNVESEDVILKLVIDYFKMREEFEDRGEDTEEDKPEEAKDSKEEVSSELYDYKKIFSKEYYKKQFSKETNNEEEPDSEDVEKEKHEPKETISFDINWNLKSVEPLKNYKLSTDEKRDLLKKVRLSFVSHSYLIQVTREKILQEFTDLILEAMSLKLSKFENSNTDYTINCQPRNAYVPESEINPNKFVRGNKNHKHNIIVPTDDNETPHNVSSNKYQHYTANYDQNHESKPGRQEFNNNKPLYEMKEVESVIQLDEQVQPEPKSHFNEYKYNNEPTPPPTTKPSLKSKLQKHQRKKPNPAPIRRNVNNNMQIKPNQYYSGQPQNNYQHIPNQSSQGPTQYMNNQDRGNPRLATHPDAQPNMDYSRNQHHNVVSQGRVTLPSKYETQNNQNQDNLYNNMNNNQAIADLDEFQPTLYSQPDQPYKPQKPKQQDTYQPQEPNPINIEGDISQISLPNVKSNATLYQNINQQEKPISQKNSKLVKKEFVFKYNSDKNGLFYFLGTRGGRREYVNPFELGEIKVFLSSLSQGDYSNFVGRALTNCRTCNEENAFMGVDLGKDR